MLCALYLRKVGTLHLGCHTYDTSTLVSQLCPLKKKLWDTAGTLIFYLFLVLILNTYLVLLFTLLDLILGLYSNF